MADDDTKYLDACVQTNGAGREQLRIAALAVAEAVLGYSQDTLQRRDALMYQNQLQRKPGALALCNAVRAVWQLGAVAEQASTDIASTMAQMKQVAKNVYEGKVGSSFPWLAVIVVAGLGVGGYFGIRAICRGAHHGRARLHPGT